MAAVLDRRHEIGVHPLHALLLGAMLPLFAGGLLSDLAYSSSYEIQWSNFASWLIAGATLFTGLALLWAVIDLIRAGTRGKRRLIYALMLIAVFAVGLLNSFVHARDAWAVMPQGLILSVVVTLLASAAVWLGYAKERNGDRQ